MWDQQIFALARKKRTRVSGPPKEKRMTDAMARRHGMAGPETNANISAYSSHKGDKWRREREKRGPSFYDETFETHNLR